MIRFRVYPSGLIHYGRENGAPYGAMHYLSLCGRDMIGYPVEDPPHESDAVCRRCEKAFARAQATYESLRERFGASS